MSEIHGGVGSYVADALDDEEKEEFEAHLAVCDTCSREVVEFGETAAQLSVLAATPPPPELRSRVLAAIREVRPWPPETGSPALLDATSQPTTAEPATTPAVDELALRRQRRTARFLSLAVAAAMVVALALGGWVYALVQQREAQVAATTLETQLLSAPDAKVYTTRATNGASVSFVVSKQLDKAMFVGTQLPAAGAGKAYQLWTIDPRERPVPDRIFTGAGSEKQWFSGPVRTAAALAVTVEPSGGSPQPTTDPVAAATL